MVAPGTRLGGYELLAPIGSGGMGDVYRARDGRLGRDVAVKILPDAFADDPDRLARFEREARVLASLNHPHIGAIYGVEEADAVGEGHAVKALILELVEGPTLAERLRASAPPVREALDLARQIAEALEAAHEKGIVHRDLKPSNIKVTPAGSVKVLDFGIAKMRPPVEDAVPDEASTVATVGTRPGVVLGTPAYMSPEQARGHAADKRTDIWAFGCVLYEMLARRAAFAGDTVSDTLVRVLEREPEWARLPGRTPPGIGRLLRRCLEKDPRRRLRDIGDARIELEDALATPSAPAAALVVPGWKRLTTRAAPWLAIAAAFTFASVALSRWGTPPQPPAVEVRSVRLTDLTGLEEHPAISPDGRSVAFTAGEGDKRHVFVQLIAGGGALRITRDEVDHRFPRWSPDSSAILYFSSAATGDAQGDIWEISALGGVARRIISSLGGADVSRVNGRLALFRLAEKDIQLVTASRDGSSVEVVSQLPPATYYRYPRWSPDGKWIAFQGGDSIRSDVFVVSADGGEPRRLTHDNNVIDGLAWLPDSTGIIYSSSRGASMPYLPALSLWQVTLRDGTVRPVRSGETSYHQPDIAETGAIAVSRRRMQSDIWRFPVEGLPAENVRRAVRVTRQTGQVLTPTVGPGDKEVAFLSDSGGHANLWVVDTESGERRQITHERDPSVAVGLPVWSPDGSSIAFVYSRGNPGLTFGVWLVRPDGSDLRNIANPGLGPAWSPDGRWLYYSTRGDATVADVVLNKVPAGGGPAVTVTTEPLRNVIGSDGSTLYYLYERPLVDGTPEFEIRAAQPENAPFRVLTRIPAARVPIWQTVNPALSPDGRWLAQALTDGFTTNIWALATATREWHQITDFGERPTFIVRRVSWSSDGRSIFAALGEGDADVVLLEGAVNLQRE